MLELTKKWGKRIGILILALLILSGIVFTFSGGCTQNQKLWVNHAVSSKVGLKRHIEHVDANGKEYVYEGRIKLEYVGSWVTFIDPATDLSVTLPAYGTVIQEIK